MKQSRRIGGHGISPPDERESSTWPEPPLKKLPSRLSRAPLAETGRLTYLTDKETKKGLSAVRKKGVAKPSTLARPRDPSIPPPIPKGRRRLRSLPPLAPENRPPHGVSRPLADVSCGLPNDERRSGMLVSKPVRTPPRASASAQLRGRADGPDTEEFFDQWKTVAPSSAVDEPISADEMVSTGYTLKDGLRHLIVRLKNKRAMIAAGVVLAAGVAIAALVSLMSSSGRGKDTRLAARNRTLPEHAGGGTSRFAIKTSPVVAPQETPTSFERPVSEKVAGPPDRVPAKQVETPKPMDVTAGDGIPNVETDSPALPRPAGASPAPSSAKPGNTAAAPNANASPVAPKRKTSDAPPVEQNSLAAILTGSDPESKKLPLGLSREVVQRGMSKVAGRAKQCSKTEKRPVVVAVTIARNGTVSSAVATGDFAGTPVGGCVARVARAARFPPSVKETTVHYPFFP